MTRRLLTLAVAFGASTISGSSSVVAQATAQGQPSVFRTAARLVQVNVTVMDSRGQPVTDLNAGDFTIRESGKPREIALFGFEGGTSRAAPPPPLPPRVFSNQVQFIGGPPRNVTALILDMVNTSTRDNFFVRSQVLHYLKKSHTSDTRLAIYVLSGDGLKTIAEFTEDADLLRSRLDQTVVSLPPVIPFRQDRIRRTLDALDAVGRHLEGIPGRKSVVWISGGFSVLDVSEIMGMGPHVSIDGILEADVRNAAQSLAQRGIALYIVSASGLRGGLAGTRPRVECHQEAALLSLTRFGGRAKSAMVCVEQWG